MNRQGAVLPSSRRACRSTCAEASASDAPIDRSATELRRVFRHTCGHGQVATRGTGPQSPPRSKACYGLLQARLVKTVNDHVISGKGAWCRPSVATGAEALFSLTWSGRVHNPTECTLRGCRGGVPPCTLTLSWWASWDSMSHVSAIANDWVTGRSPYGAVLAYGGSMYSLATTSPALMHRVLLKASGADVIGRRAKTRSCAANARPGSVGLVTGIGQSATMCCWVFH